MAKRNSTVISKFVHLNAAFLASKWSAMLLEVYEHFREASVDSRGPELDAKYGKYSFGLKIGRIVEADVEECSGKFTPKSLFETIAMARGATLEQAKAGFDAAVLELAKTGQLRIVQRKGWSFIENPSLRVPYAGGKADAVSSLRSKLANIPAIK